MNLLRLMNDSLGSGGSAAADPGGVDDAMDEDG